SADVVAHVMGPAPPGFSRFALIGNHEQMMLDFLGNPAAHAYWLEEGGLETLASYGIRLDFPPLRSSEALRRMLEDRLPADHRQFIETLPTCLSLPGWLFVHAGIRPGIPLGMQSDDDLIWIR